MITREIKNDVCITEETFHIVPNISKTKQNFKNEKSLINDKKQNIIK